MKTLQGIKNRKSNHNASRKPESIINSTLIVIQMQLLSNEPPLDGPVNAAFPFSVQSLESLEEHSGVEESIYGR